MSDFGSSEALQDRTAALHQLTEFTQDCRTQLTQLFDALGWNWDHCSGKQNQMEVCPFDPGHTVPCRSMENHKSACVLSRLGYSKEEQAEMCNASFFYEKASIPSLKLDKHVQHQIIQQARLNAPPVQSPGIYCFKDYSSGSVDVPQNHKRAVCDLTAADRLALYEHAVQEARQQSAEASSNEDLYVDLVSKLNKDEEKSSPKSHLEVLAEMRDYRRRRQSYRAKNVHITKKSYTEIIREVIDVHSSELAKLWQEERDELTKTLHTHRRPSDEGRSASVESRDSRVASRGENSSRHKHHKRSSERSPESSSKSRKRASHSSDESRHKKKKKRKTK